MEKYGFAVQWGHSPGRGWGKHKEEGKQKEHQENLRSGELQVKIMTWTRLTFEKNYGT